MRMRMRIRAVLSEKINNKSNRIFQKIVKIKSCDKRIVGGTIRKIKWKRSKNKFVFYVK